MHNSATAPSVLAGIGSAKPSIGTTLQSLFPLLGLINYN